MSRFLFSLAFAAGFSCSAAAFAQTQNAAKATAEPATHATLMGGHIAMPQNGMSHPLIYSSDHLRTGNLASQPVPAMPSQEFLNSVGK